MRYVHAHRQTNNQDTRELTFASRDGSTSTPKTHIGRPYVARAGQTPGFSTSLMCYAWPALPTHRTHTPPSRPRSKHATRALGGVVLAAALHNSAASCWSRSYIDAPAVHSENARSTLPYSPSTPSPQHQLPAVRVFLFLSCLGLQVTSSGKRKRTRLVGRLPRFGPFASAVYWAQIRTQRRTDHAPVERRAMRAATTRPHSLLRHPRLC